MPRTFDEKHLARLMQEEIGPEGPVIASYIALGIREARSEVLNRRRVLRVAIWVAIAMLLCPPWSSVNSRISSAGYGPLFVGPMEYSALAPVFVVFSQGDYRLDVARLTVQLLALGAVVSAISLMPTSQVVRSDPVVHTEPSR